MQASEARMLMLLDGIHEGLLVHDEMGVFRTATYRSVAGRDTRARKCCR
jgi:hypothetical protein